MKSKCLLAAGFLFVATLSHAEELEPGSPAPALSVKTWYKGTPIKAFKRNKIYVVEFWATWCGPCLRSIPHVTELAKKNKDVTFIGVSVREDDDGKNIKKFIAKMGKTMDYNVGYSGNQTGMYQTWMKATGQTFIPNAYIIKNNTVQWIGHPLDMEQPLKEVKAGKFDVSAFRTKFDKAKVDYQIQQAQGALSSLISTNKFAEAKAGIAEFAKKYPLEKYPTAKVDDLNTMLDRSWISNDTSEILNLLREKKQTEAAHKLDEFKVNHPAAKTDVLEFRVFATGDQDLWMKKVREVIATNTLEAYEPLAIYLFEQVSTGGNATHAKFIIDALLEDIHKEDFLKYYILCAHSYGTKDYKKALDYLDKVEIALPLSPQKIDPQFKDLVPTFRAEIIAKSKG